MPREADLSVSIARAERDRTRRAPGGVRTARLMTGERSAMTRIEAPPSRRMARFPGPIRMEESGRAALLWRLPGLDAGSDRQR